MSTEWYTQIHLYVSSVVGPSCMPPKESFSPKYFHKVFGNIKDFFTETTLYQTKPKKKKKPFSWILHCHATVVLLWSVLNISLHEQNVFPNHTNLCLQNFDQNKPKQANQWPPKETKNLICAHVKLSKHLEVESYWLKKKKSYIFFVPVK